MVERLRKRRLLPSVRSVERMIAIMTEASGALLSPRFSSTSVGITFLGKTSLAGNGWRLTFLTVALAVLRDYENGHTAA